MEKAVCVALALVQLVLALQLTDFPLRQQLLVEQGQSQVEEKDEVPELVLVVCSLFVVVQLAQSSRLPHRLCLHYLRLRLLFVVFAGLSLVVAVVDIVAVVVKHIEAALRPVLSTVTFGHSDNDSWCLHCILDLVLGLELELVGIVVVRVDIVVAEAVVGIVALVVDIAIFVLRTEVAVVGIVVEVEAAGTEAWA